MTRACDRRSTEASSPSAPASPSKAISVGSPRSAAAPPEVASSALLHAASAAASAAATGELPATVSADPSPAGVHTRSTRIRLSVSVPVLSVQMTVVDPSVSTAESRLTSAP